MEGNNMTQGAVQLYIYNVRGLRDVNKRKKIFHFMQNKSTGVLLLQETHSTETDENNWKREWPGAVFMAHGTNYARGVAILIPKEYKVKLPMSILMKMDGTLC